MLTIERTEDWVIVKLPPTVTDEELRALEEAYAQTVQKEPAVEVEEQSLAIPGYMDEDGFIVDEEILGELRAARKGAWESLKETFKDNREFDAVIALMEEE